MIFSYQRLECCCLCVAADWVAVYNPLKLCIFGAPFLRSGSCCSLFDGSKKTKRMANFLLLVMLARVFDSLRSRQPFFWHRRSALRRCRGSVGNQRRGNGGLRQKVRSSFVHDGVYGNVLFYVGSNDILLACTWH